MQKVNFINKNRGEDSYLEEIGLNLKSLSWYHIKTHYLYGRYYDIDITNKFAILRGRDAHRIIYH